MTQHSRGAMSPILWSSCAITAALLLVSVLLVGIHSGANAQPAYTLCDANLSGEVTISDALLVAQHVVDLTTLTGDGLAAADCNGDGNVTISDSLLIAQQVVGLA